MKQTSSALNAHIKTSPILFSVCVSCLDTFQGEIPNFSPGYCAEMKEVKWLGCWRSLTHNVVSQSFCSKCLLISTWMHQWFLPCYYLSYKKFKFLNSVCCPIRSWSTALHTFCTTHHVVWTIRQNLTNSFDIDKLTWNSCIQKIEQHTSRSLSKRPIYAHKCTANLRQPDRIGCRS